MTTKPLALHQTTVGKKAIMAVTGIILIGFVLGHMVGNLQVFQGPEKLNAYAAFLQGLGGALWIVRLGLLAAVGAHIWAAVTLVMQNSAARPEKYHVKHDVVTSYAAKTMRYGGVLVLLFLVYHLMHLTGHVVGPHDGIADGDVYSRVILGFQDPVITGFYVVANLALGMHLFHGVWSLMQSLGLSHVKYNKLRGLAAAGIAGIVTLGNVIMPVAVLAGMIK
jgi:succinate dehydrogenase / fumarate reductase cytochrome b subunit